MPAVQQMSCTRRIFAFCANFTLPEPVLRRCGPPKAAWPDMSFTQPAKT